MSSPGRLHVAAHRAAVVEPSCETVRRPASAKVDFALVGRRSELARGAFEPLEHGRANERLPLVVATMGAEEPNKNVLRPSNGGRGARLAGRSLDASRVGLRVLPKATRLCAFSRRAFGALFDGHGWRFLWSSFCSSRGHGGPGRGRSVVGHASPIRETRRLVKPRRVRRAATRSKLLRGRRATRRTQAGWPA